MAEVAVFAFVGKAVATSVISNLVGKAFSYLDERMKSEGLTATKESLTRALPQIQSVLAAVDRGQIMEQNPALDDWLWQLRDAVEEAEDAIDELEYYKLEDKIKARDKEVKAQDKKLHGTLSKYTKKLKEIVKHSPSTSGNTLKRLKEAVKGLDKVATGVGPFLQLVSGLGISGDGKNQGQDVIRGGFRAAGSFLTESVVFGRGKEKDMIVQWLCEPVQDGCPNVSAYSIVGMGGLGKTTLAQSVYNEIRGKHVLNFNPAIWICISDNFGTFNATEIIRKILQDITCTNIDLQNLSTLQRILKEKVASRKFLLVLDDIWRDDTRNEWEKVMAPLKFGQKGSKILLTTRMELVADMISKVMEGNKKLLRLGGLEENDFLMLFNKHAFDGVNAVEYQNLQSIGKQIAKKLGGCPLAAKVMGGILNHCLDFTYWNTILKNDISNVQAGQNGIMMILRLSYNHLPTDLKLCFRYCSLLPQHHYFIKDDLVKMWMGSGLIRWSKDQGQRPEDIGAEYFDHLARKSFFDPLRGLKDYFVMHDLLYEMARSVSLGECLRIEGDLAGSIPKTIRHIHVKIKSLISIKEISHLGRLHSLIIEFEGPHSELDDIAKLKGALKEMKSLRLLRLTGEKLFECPAVVGDLIHLRYICFEQTSIYNELAWFPKSVYRLYHLEVMQFSAYGLKEISKIEMGGMHNLIKLRYLEVLDDVMKSIPSIGRLTSLQVLDRFCIREEEGYKICELKDLKGLHELRVNNLERLSNPKEAQEAKLNEKENLKSLSLYWYAGDCSNSEKILDDLLPHAHLQELRIKGYQGIRSPIWMIKVSLVNLASLKLESCSKWESLPPLGKLPSLEKLWLIDFPEVEKIGHSLYGSGGDCAFPSLKELRINKMVQLEEWVDVDEKYLFPRLEILEFDICPNLRAFATLPLSLRELCIHRCGLQIVPRMHNSSSDNTMASKPSLSMLSIINCPDLTSLNCGLFLQEEVFFDLEKLSIIGCRKLVHFPPYGFAGLPSLKRLGLEGCPMLVTQGIRENLLPSSLRYLTIKECGIEVSLLHSLQDLASLTRLDLNSCSNITSLPSVQVFASLTALRELHILECKELLSLGGLGALLSLANLRIRDCDKLVTVSLDQPPIEIDANQGDLAGTTFKTRCSRYRPLLPAAFGAITKALLYQKAFYFSRMSAYSLT